MRILYKWLYYDSVSLELQSNGDIESYDNIMEQYPNYPKIWYNLILVYKQKIKEYFNL
jgi:hypothetical protein